MSTSRISEGPVGRSMAEVPIPIYMALPPARAACETRTMKIGESEVSRLYDRSRETEASTHVNGHLHAAFDSCTFKDDVETFVQIFDSRYNLIRLESLPRLFPSRHGIGSRDARATLQTVSGRGPAVLFGKVQPRLIDVDGDGGGGSLRPCEC